MQIESTRAGHADAQQMPSDPGFHGQLRIVHAERKALPGEFPWTAPVLPSHHILTISHCWVHTCQAGREASWGCAAGTCWPWTCPRSPTLNSTVAFNLMSDLDCVSTLSLFHDCFTFCIRLVSDQCLVWLWFMICYSSFDSFSTRAGYQCKWTKGNAERCKGNNIILPGGYVVEKIKRTHYAGSLWSAEWPLHKMSRSKPWNF